MPGLIDPDQCRLRHLAHHIAMERVELLRARIALYRRYLREGAESDMARAYLWLIRQDEIELRAITTGQKSEPQTDTGGATQTVRTEDAEKPEGEQSDGS